MNVIRITPQNVKNYIGHNIIFNSRNQKYIKKIISVSESGNSIKIDHPDLNNSLQIVSRRVYVIP